MQAKNRFLETRSEYIYIYTQTHRCEVADKAQVEINFLQTHTTLIVSNFSLRAAGQRGLMSRKRTPFARNVGSHILRSRCNVGLSWANPFPRNASRPSKAVVKL